MVVCDHLKRIRYFTSRHCGSAHDSRIFNESHLRAQLENQFDPEDPLVLLGDEGYSCSRVLLTPIRHDRIATPSQAAYNAALKKIRVFIEHVFGMVKKCFPALLYELRCRKIANAQALIGNTFGQIKLTLR